MDSPHQRSHFWPSVRLAAMEGEEEQEESSEEEEGEAAPARRRQEGRPARHGMPCVHVGFTGGLLYVIGLLLLVSLAFPSHGLDPFPSSLFGLLCLLNFCEANSTCVGPAASSPTCTAATPCACFA